MDKKTWDALTPAQKEQQRSSAGLTPQLIGLERWRVEVLDLYGNKRRFIVGRSTGWVPCHIELKTRHSDGGGAADKQYASVKRLYKIGE